MSVHSAHVREVIPHAISDSPQQLNAWNRKDKHLANLDGLGFNSI